jgi:ABC-type branched-subunit amino acid transport system ATPase component
MQTVTRLAREGIAVLLVEQHVHRALEIADHAYVLERGRIVYDGPPHGVDVTAVLAGVA